MITPDAVQRYSRDGILFPIPVLSPEEVERYRTHVEEIVKGGRSKAVRQPHFEQPWAYDLGLHPRMLDAVQSILGDDVMVHSTLIFYKPARDAGFVSWHQDGLYPGLRAPHLTTAWIALTPSIPENGCLRVIPGSHHGGIVHHREEQTENNLLKNGQTIDGIEESAAIDVILRPGEMSLHHRDLAHASNPNDSDLDRIGFVVRCITPEAEFTGHPVIAARGCPNIEHLAAKGVRRIGEPLLG